MIGRFAASGFTACAALADGWSAAYAFARYVGRPVVVVPPEESAKAVMGAVVAGSAATAARYVGLTSGALVFLLHRGRDVSLDAYTELELTLSREVYIPSRPPQ